MKDEISKLNTTISRLVKSQDLKTSKVRMELAIKILERRAAQIGDNVAFFRRIPASEFDKEHLVMLCNLFAEEWHKAKHLNDSLLSSKFVGEINQAFVEHTLLNKFVEEQGSNPTKYEPQMSLWRKIWNRIKEWA